MSEHATSPTFHRKKHGKIHHCAWCGQTIKVSEDYAKWLWFDGGERSTVYAHIECYSVWDTDDYPCGSYERPKEINYERFRKVG